DNIGPEHARCQITGREDVVDPGGELPGCAGEAAGTGMHAPVAVDVALLEQSLDRPSLDEAPEEPIHGAGDREAHRERRHDTWQHRNPSEQARIHAGATPPVREAVVPPV